MDTKTNLLANSIKSAKDIIDFINANKNNISAKEAKTIYKDIEFIKGRLNAYKSNYDWSCIDTDAYPLRGVEVANSDARDSDFLNKALVDNDNIADVAKVIDTVINTPRQDAQPKTDKEAVIEHRLNAEEALAKTRRVVIGIINSAICGHVSVINAADDIIRVVNSINKPDYDADSVANADVNYIVNVDAAAHGKDKSNRRVFRRDVNGRIIELRGVNTDAPDELY